MANTVNTMITSVNASMNQRVSTSERREAKLPGNCETIPAKITSESPCPRMPYSEINSPSHMENMVPAVIATITESEASHCSALKPNSRIGCPTGELMDNELK